jgi:hypothetical protein
VEQTHTQGVITLQLVLVNILVAVEEDQPKLADTHHKMGLGILHKIHRLVVKVETDSLIL